MGLTRTTAGGSVQTLDLRTASVRELNAALHALDPSGAASHWQVRGAAGEHALAVGVDAPCTIEIEGHVGYYCAGMNKQAAIEVRGNAGTGVAENMMSGMVRIRGNASQSAGATAHGGLLVVEGDAAARCGISLKGLDIVVGGNAGHMSGFMAQKGRIVICGDAGDGLGDSLYEADIYVRGKVAGLGADCEEKAMEAVHREALASLLDAAAINVPVDGFRRYGSARRLYHFDIDNADAY